MYDKNGLRELMAAAYGSLRATHLPANASLLLSQRHKVARQLIEGLATLGVLRAAQNGLELGEESAAFQQLIEQTTSECERLGERLLQLAASPDLSEQSQ